MTRLQGKVGLITSFTTRDGSRRKRGMPHDASGKGSPILYQTADISNSLLVEISQ